MKNYLPQAQLPTLRTAVLSGVFRNDEQLTNVNS